MLRSSAILLAVLAAVPGTSAELSAQTRKPARASAPTKAPATTPAPIDTAPAFASAVGVVADSIRLGPLTGAVVRVAGTTRQDSTDARGEYHIDSIPPGVHRLSLHHPLLDTLGMALVTPEIDFPAGRATVVVLGVPSAQTMLEIACSEAARRTGAAAVLGVVRDPDTGAPAVGARVTLTWTEVQANKTVGVRTTRRARTAVVDSAGNYAICGLPAGLQGALRATRDGASTAEVSVAVDSASPIGLRSLSLGASEPVRDSVTGRVLTLRRGPATLRGRVTGPDGAALAQARVEVPGTPAVALTNDAGAFTLTGLPVGTQTVIARQVGFRPSEMVVEVSARTRREVTITLSTVQVLPTLETVAATGLDKVGFTDRQRARLGKFITEEDVKKRNPVTLTDMLTTVPGLRVTTDAYGHSQLESTRATPGSISGNCVSVFVDHALWQSLTPGDLDNYVPPDQIAGIEVYPSTTAPAEFSAAGQSCQTVVVVWTKTKVGDQK